MFYCSGVKNNPQLINLLFRLVGEPYFTAENVKKEYGVVLKTVGSIGISAMMHGYMAFDDKQQILVPFRTWRNTNTAQAAAELSELFGEIMEFKLRVFRRTDSLRVAKRKHIANIRHSWSRPS